MNMQDIRSRKFIPADMGLDEATDSARGGSMGIGACPGDVEIIAIRGIGISLGFLKRRFTGVTVTDGLDAARIEPDKELSDEQMIEERLKEQNIAAALGKYALQHNLLCRSAEIQDPHTAQSRMLVKEIAGIVSKVKPQVIYTHNPFDEHSTRVMVMRAVIEALRSLPYAEQPQELYGCEVWGDLDWLPQGRKKILDVTGFTEIQHSLIGCHDSRRAEKYGDATLWREFSNAAWARPRDPKVEAAVLAVDLMPLLDNPELDICDFANDIQDEFNVGRLSTLAKNLHLSF